jgi:hypothetical protein
MSVTHLADTEVRSEEPTIEELKGYSLVPDSMQPNGLSIRWHHRTLMGPFQGKSTFVKTPADYKSWKSVVKMHLEKGKFNEGQSDTTHAALVGKRVAMTRDLKNGLAKIERYESDQDTPIIHPGEVTEDPDMGKSWTGGVKVQRW